MFLDSLINMIVNSKNKVYKSYLALLHKIKSIERYRIRSCLIDLLHHLKKHYVSKFVSSILQIFAVISMHKALF